MEQALSIDKAGITGADRALNVKVVRGKFVKSDKLKGFGEM